MLQCAFQLVGDCVPSGRKSKPGRSWRIAAASRDLFVHAVELGDRNPGERVRSPSVMELTFCQCLASVLTAKNVK